MVKYDTSDTTNLFSVQTEMEQINSEHTVEAVDFVKQIKVIAFSKFDEPDAEKIRRCIYRSVP